MLQFSSMFVIYFRTWNNLPFVHSCPVRGLIKHMHTWQAYKIDSFENQGSNVIFLFSMYILFRIIESFWLICTTKFEQRRAITFS